MSEKEIKILEKFEEAFPEMSEAEKMYLLGRAEQMVDTKKRQKEVSSNKKPS